MLVWRIGDETKHVSAPRRLPHGYFREIGWDNGNRTLEDTAAAVENQHPLWSIKDLRLLGGGLPHENRNDTYYSRYTAYHFHNWFANFSSMRFKYLSYGHPRENAFKTSLEELHPDVEMMVKCAKEQSDMRSKRKRVRGRFNGLRPFVPIYFACDADYRRRKHADLVRNLNGN